MRKIMLVIDDYQDLVAMENLLRRLGFDVMAVGKELLVNDALLRFQADFLIASLKGRNVDGIRLALQLKKRALAPRVALLAGSDAELQLTAEAQMAVDAVIDTPIQPKWVIQVTARVLMLDVQPILAKYDKLTTNRFPATDGKDARKIIGGEDGSGNELNPQSASSRFITAKQAATQAEQSQKIRAAESAANEESRLITGDVSRLTPDVNEKQSHKGDAEARPESAATIRTERSNRYDQFLAANDDGPVTGTLSREKAEKAMKKLKADSEKDRDELDRIDREKRAFAKALFEVESDAEPRAKK